VVEAVPDAPTPGAPAAIRCALQPRSPDAAFDGLAAVAPQRLVEDLAAVLADVEAGDGGCGAHGDIHRSPSARSPVLMACLAAWLPTAATHSPARPRRRPPSRAAFGVS